MSIANGHVLGQHQALASPKRTYPFDGIAFQVASDLESQPLTVGCAEDTDRTRTIEAPGSPQVAPWPHVFLAWPDD